MKYATFVENNHKDNEMYIYYLQYDGNEEQLMALKEIIDDSDCEKMYGDYSEFNLDIDNLVSQITVDEQLKIRFDGYSPFDVCNGSFEFYEEDFYNLDEHEKALKLDDMFYSRRIEDYFN